MEVLPGRPLDNTSKILQWMEEARRDNVELIVFPEMAIPGYLLGDEWEHEAFLRECEACANEVRAASTGLIAVFGSVGLDWNRRNEDGRVRKYNAVFVAESGEFKGPEGGPCNFVVKTLLPNYRVFDDSRHFHDLRKLALERGESVHDMIRPVRTNRLSLGCMLCEDTWDMDYGISPLAALARTGCDLLINVSSSPYTLNKNHKRHRVFSRRMHELKRPLIYVNNVGIQNNGKTILTFDGSSCIHDSDGGIITSGEPFAETQLTFDIPLPSGTPFGKPALLRDDGIDDLARSILYGTRKTMDLLGVSRVAVGVSGGIDSAVVASLYSRILKPSDLLLVNMPGTYTSRTTRNLAVNLADNLNCLYTEIPIEESMHLTRRQLDHLQIQNRTGTLRETLQLSSLNLENIQARDRSSRVLAAVASAFGGVFTCNANKSEVTVGYTTLYGDLGGYLANIADLWKIEVYQLARHLNANVFGREVIPTGSINIMPSAELSAAQDVDKGMGDPLKYPYHDRLFKSWVEWWNRVTPQEILEWYIEGHLEEKLEYDKKVSDLFKTAEDFISDLEKWWALYQGMGLAKRIQAPPILAVKRRAFGFDHRESQMGVRYTRKYQELRKTLLQKSNDS